MQNRIIQTGADKRFRLIIPEYTLETFTIVLIRGKE